MKEKPYNIDIELEDADWVRTQNWDLPSDLEGFNAHLAEHNMSLLEFVKLPAARAMPESLRRALGLPGPESRPADSTPTDETAADPVSSRGLMSPNFIENVEVLPWGDEELLDEDRDTPVEKWDWR